MSDASPTSLTRLNKAIADSGYCARRKADALIAAGNVQVNGETVTALGTKVDLSIDAITIDGQPLPQTGKFYLLFHKPAGYVTSRVPQGQQKTIYHLIPKIYQAVDPAGRLDQDSSGLLILSSDGDFLHQVTHPRFHWEKVYEITLDRQLSPENIAQLQDGILLEPENKVATMSNIRQLAPNTAQYQVTLTTGYNRQIRRTIEAIGARIQRLHRVRFGPILLNQIEEGTLRPLTHKEQQSLLSITSH